MAGQIGSGKSAPAGAKCTFTLPYQYMKQLEEAVLEWISHGATVNEQMERSKLLQLIITGKLDEGW